MRLGGKRVLLEHNVYEYGYVFTLSVSLVALGFLFVNRSSFKTYNYYPYYMAFIVAFSLATLLYVLSVLTGKLLMHAVAGFAEMLAILAIVWVGRKEFLKNDRDD